VWIPIRIGPVGLPRFPGWVDIPIQSRRLEVYSGLPLCPGLSRLGPFEHCRGCTASSALPLSFEVLQLCERDMWHACRYFWLQGTIA
jgi:hypothetical protein